MYLKKLYKQHKGWFIVVILFAIVQLANNIRQDIAISPVYAYGMYSEYIPQNSPQVVFEITANGKMLQPQHFSTHQWDKIILPLQYYANSACNNNGMYARDIKRLLHTFNIEADSSKFMYPFNQDEFTNWYRSYLSSIIGEKIDSLHINMPTYQFSPSFHKIQNQPFAQLCN